ncbi:MAG: hypothetical protein EXR54_01365 [Dehalococcoidia bacterium]|nr:hypothetical protein [Dehalococcoidia bacterium]
MPRPWYYQFWFLYPSFLFWPVWPVLIIRSPWQGSLLAGSIAWAVLISGVVLGAVRLAKGGTVAYSTLAVIAPGLILTLIIQAHWIAYRRSVTAATAGQADTSAGVPRRSRRTHRRGRRGRS